MIKTALTNSQVVRKLLAKAQASIDADEFGETPWDEGRMMAYDMAEQIAPSDLKSWAIDMLNQQSARNEQRFMDADFSGGGRMERAEGREAGYRDIIDELCAQEAHHDPVRA